MCDSGGSPVAQDLDEKERQLEEQQNRVQSLSNILAKQQNVAWTEKGSLFEVSTVVTLEAAMGQPRLTSLTVERDRLRDERDRLWSEAGAVAIVSMVGIGWDWLGESCAAKFRGAAIRVLSFNGFVMFCDSAVSFDRPKF
eukprot:Skav215868  [mRNA]  locus=scaffold3733:63333:65365:+ [translate_table: standard]